ncbi:uncharacterized protein PHALS_01047 [Plasmopara halstedii]|uniref:Uncharacterized protein n=1 Tax=Plasmopara halstedii TaxID=4781 RepID=A0A0P1ATX8_PLAHL|nr:uncharacterized protein PHALS_01047 [Plasmopara halstedii]CEG44702.1 hypothetical protein PHALS_01047 [Plasmopara halstedii]|eukprot:XP_024581071.1 hypothetical protein PHALS_01047 [Plasmopara halstedii]
MAAFDDRLNLRERGVSNNEPTNVAGKWKQYERVLGKEPQQRWEEFERSLKRCGYRICSVCGSAYWKLPFL